jgi:hypothetical protein
MTSVDFAISFAGSVETMKTAAEYLDLALQFDRLATFEESPKLKADFEKQGAAYRKLAEARMENTGLESPKISN